MFTKKKLIISTLFVVPIMNAFANEAEQTVSSSDVDTVIVTATMGAKKIEEVPAFSTVVTADDIAKSTVNSVADLLRETVGVNNLSDAKGRDEIQIRGLDGDYTVLLINGKRVNSKGAFAKDSDTDLNSISLNAIERIEIIRGPMSVLYGADAIGGVVNIITKKPIAGEGWSGSVSAEIRKIESGEGGDQYRLGAFGRGAITDKVSMSISVEDLGQEAWYADDDDTNPLKEEKEAQNLSTTVSWQAADNQQVDFDFGYNHDYRPYQIYDDAGDYRKQEITRLDFAVTHKGQWDWADTTAFIKREQSDVYDYNSSYDEPEHDDLEANNTYAKAYLNKSVSIHNILSGVDYENQQIKDSYSFLDTGEYSTEQYGAFVQDEIALLDNLALTLAGRVDYHDIYGDNYSPKAYLVYSMSDALTIKGGVTKAFKAPDATYLTEEYSVLSCGGSCYLSGNPDLEAETSISYEFGVDYHTRGFNLSGTVFRNNIDNLIERELIYDTSGTLTGAQWVNVAKAMTQGVELSSSAAITNDLMIKANYTYLDTEAEDSDGETTVLEGRPEHQASLTLDHQTTDMFATFLSVNYINGMQYSAWDSTLGETVYSVLPSYYRTDIGVIADVSDDLVIRAGVKNIGDVRLDEEDTGYTTYEIGRNYYLSVAYNF